MSMRIISYNVWLSLSPDVRHKLVQLFDLKRSGNTIVEYRASGNVVTSDGYTPSDLMSITTEKMQALLDSDSEDYYGLFEATIDNIDAIISGSYRGGGLPVEPEKVAAVEQVEITETVTTTVTQTTEVQVSEDGAAEVVVDTRIPWRDFVKKHRGQGMNLKQLAELYKQQA